MITQLESVKKEVPRYYKSSLAVGTRITKLGQSSNIIRDTSVQGTEETAKSLWPMVRQIVNYMALSLPTYLSKDDLIGAGAIGLMDGIEKFDATKGSSIKTYCSLRIRGAILDELRRLDWVPRGVHEDARTMAQAQEELSQKLGREATPEEVRIKLNLSKAKYRKLQERVKPAVLMSLQDTAFRQEEGDQLINEEIVANENAPDAVANLLDQEDRELLVGCLQRLPKIQAQVMVLYYIEELQLKKIAQVLNVTESRVSQIHTAALARLREHFQNARSN